MNRNQSIVIGASIAGLAAAKVLSETFSHVLVLEQDDPPTLDKPRRYVPQGAQLHLLQRGGVMAAEKIFPEFAEEMKRSGIAPFEMTTNTSMFLHRVWVTPAPSSSNVYPQTRPHLEHYFYDKVKEVKHIEIRHATRVRELLWDEHHQVVLGVILTTGEQIRADLVIDASGRATRLPIWLEEAGYTKPHTGKDRWYITLVGYHGDHPSSIPEEYRLCQIPAYGESHPGHRIIRT